MAAAIEKQPKLFRKRDIRPWDKKAAKVRNLGLLQRLRAFGFPPKPSSVAEAYSIVAVAGAAGDGATVSKAMACLLQLEEALKKAKKKQEEAEMAASSSSGSDSSSSSSTSTPTYSGSLFRLLLMTKEAVSTEMRRDIHQTRIITWHTLGQLFESISLEQQIIGGRDYLARNRENAFYEWKRVKIKMSEMLNKLEIWGDPGSEYAIGKIEREYEDFSRRITIAGAAGVGKIHGVDFANGTVAALRDFNDKLTRINGMYLLPIRKFPVRRPIFVNRSCAIDQVMRWRRIHEPISGRFLRVEPILSKCYVPPHHWEDSEREPELIL